MNTSLLGKKFKEMGARLKLEEISRRSSEFRINILEDKEGEYFSILLGDPELLDVNVVNIQAKERHLLLVIRDLNNQEGLKNKFLCGHDERHWFVAAVPGQGVRDVSSAMEALKPEFVREQQLRKGVKGKKLKRRKNKAYIRQGEWFFIPVGNFNPPSTLILKNEPIRRGSSKPHLCEFVYRSGGERVYVNSEFPNGITQSEYNALCHKNPKYRKYNWKIMVRDAKVYAKGKVSHPDHATIFLNGWHEVAMNLEFQAPSMRNVAFLD